MEGRLFQRPKIAKLSVKQVYRAVKKWRDYGLAEKVTGGFIAIVCSEDELIEQVAIPAGTYGKTKARKYQHQRERARNADRKLYKFRMSFYAKI